MASSRLRVLLAADAGQRAAFFEQYSHQSGHEVIFVDARSESTLKAARLIHPDLVVLGSPLPAPFDGTALTIALQAAPDGPVPVVVVHNAAELAGALARQVLASQPPSGHA